MKSKIKIFESEEQAHSAVAKESIRKLVIKDKSYLLVHSSIGLVATDYLCPHLKEPLDGGRLNSFEELICPLHEYRFNLNSGSESSDRCENLTLYQIQVESDGLYLEI